MRKTAANFKAFFSFSSSLLNDSSLNGFATYSTQTLFQVGSNVKNPRVFLEMAQQIRSAFLDWAVVWMISSLFRD
jgi:hypothetical protein